MTDADTELLASSPRKLFVERTEAYNAEVKRTIAESGKTENKNPSERGKFLLHFHRFFAIIF